MDARAWVARLGLAPHPEGGFYREVVRSAAVVAHPGHGQARAALTSIYFLLPPGAFSALHRVISDEIWVHLDGDPVALHQIDDGGAHAVAQLGRDPDGGAVLQAVVLAGTWQAAVSIGEQGSLCACVVGPGFDFADFEMPPRADLIARFPALAGVVAKLTRS